eukprot:TRINITY_DN4594_c0_g2_i1.p1 TRINITY_DN4594_c0_g2~~TRINITY_DN4594_c0_g2_i1.p1  ORF type:complete len:376 (-),score=106.02 TRINITY_DN4594_c0_g2_i1:10-1137(-)
MSKLFEPIKVGDIEAKNRIFMAPLTRARATKEHVPTSLMIEYYKQRSTAGLIISEATGISQEGLGWPYAPGIWSNEQVEAWKPVTEAVHKNGGKIILQLWHMGRLVHSSFLNGEPPVSASPVTPYEIAYDPTAQVNKHLHAHTYNGTTEYERPRELKTEEIPRLIQDYRRAAQNAIKAGFDGVQLHAANGYLIDQFLRETSNKRTDQYGGSIENRTRLLREVTSALVEEIGAGRVSVRLSPNGDTQGCNDRQPYDLFTAAARILQDLNISFLELREPDFDGTFGKAEVAAVGDVIRKVFTNPLVLNSDYKKEKSDRALDSGRADAIAFGRTFISNPDLPRKLKEDLPLASDDMKTWYSQGPEGYTDYPTHDHPSA